MTIRPSAEIALNADDWTFGGVSGLHIGVQM
jgi:hypothetical protein